MHPVPTTLADAVRLYCAHGDGREGAFQVLLDEFLDAFYTETEAVNRQAMIEAEPPRIGNARQDAHVGAVGEHLAGIWGLHVPACSEAAWREVAEPWFVGRMGIGLSALFLMESPVAFRRRRIFTEAHPLRRARRLASPTPADAASDPLRGAA